jgi:hypothetical protein
MLSKPGENLTSPLVPVCRAFARIPGIAKSPRDHPSWQSALSLFVFRILANHAHHALAVHDLALVANLLD